MGVDGVVQAQFLCQKVFQGYPGQLHGGVVTALLDGAMTNCLFAHGIEAVSGELTVRFLRPVATDHIARVSAGLKKASHRLYILEAELTQKNLTVAKATGKFVKRPAGLGEGGPA